MGISQAGKYLLALCAYAAASAWAEPRDEIRWPLDCGRLPTDVTGHAQEIACAETLAGLVPDFPSEECEQGTVGSSRNAEELEQRGEQLLNAQGALPIRFYALTPGRFVIEFPCSQRAASFYALYDESSAQPHARLLQFPSHRLTHDSESKPRLEEGRVRVVEARHFDSATRSWTVLTRQQGTGICGEYARYALESDEPVLKEVRADVTCSGKEHPLTEVLARPPKDWKRIFPK